MDQNSEPVPQTRPHEHTQPDERPHETYNHWTVVNLVFHHLAGQGLHPVLGEAGNPGEAAADLLRALGIRPEAEGNRQQTENIRQRLADLRAAAFDGA
jgi:hypothetical protein